MGGLVGLLQHEFGLEVNVLEPLDVTAFNYHYVAHAGANRFHVTMHELLDDDEAAELNAVMEIVVRLDGPTAVLASSLRRSRAGRFLEAGPSGEVSVRRHWGARWPVRDGAAAGADRLAAGVLLHGQVIDRAVDRGALLRTGSPRFLPPAAKLDAVERALSERLGAWMAPAELDGFQLELAALRASDVVSPPTGLRAVHGDADVANVIAVRGSSPQLIDHDCLHWDHPLFDPAHLMLSASCRSYFVGPLDRHGAVAFLTALTSRQACSAAELCQVARYVMLGKLLAVSSPAALAASSRLGVLADLRRLAVAHDSGRS